MGMFDIHVIYEDGTETDVTVGQRDMAAWEQAGYGSSVAGPDEKPVLFFRFLAYTALKRLRQLPPSPVQGVTISFDGWSNMVDEAMPDEEEEAAGPTTPDQPQAD